MNPSVPSRRSFVLGGAGLTAAALAGLGPAAAAHPAGRVAPGSRPADARTAPAAYAARFADLEAGTSIRLGVYARDHRTGREVSWRADDTYPICSVFKAVAVAAVLRGDLVVPDRHVLTRAVHLPPAALVDNSPVVAAAVAEGRVLTVAELCVAALQRSDNTAANEILARIGGPTAVTALARRLGDRTTRLDRWETELNSAEPGRITDSTTPRAIGTTVTTLLHGRALDRDARRRLTGWMLGNRTSDTRLRAELPAGWRLADKTGGGAYAVNNDVGVAYGPNGRAISIAVLSRSDDPAAVVDDRLIAGAGKIVFDLLG